MDRRAIRDLIEAGDDALLRMADEARLKHCGETVHLRGIIEFSNVCTRDCAYCGLRRSNAALPRYTMDAEEVLRVVSDAERQGVRTIVLQSGENDAEPADRLPAVIAAIKREFDMAVTLCVGVKSPDFYESCRQSGADRYLVKHETASPVLYDTLHPDSRLDDRLYALSVLRGLDYQIGTGCIVGLPGQTSLHLADDILLTQSLDVDMAAFGPFVPHPDTPLFGTPAGELTLGLRVLAIAVIGGLLYSLLLTLLFLPAAYGLVRRKT